MKEEIKDKWVNALRSGAYQQTEFSLKVNDCFCVLGVLCDLAVKEGVADWREVGYDGMSYGRVYNKGKDSSSSSEVLVDIQQWSGLQSSRGFLMNDALAPTLSDLNDEGTNFEVLADYIEKNWKEL